MDRVQNVLRNAAVHFSPLLLLASLCLASPDAASAQRFFASTPTDQQTHTLALAFSGQQRRPLAMASGDFDEDGIQDLVIGYGVGDGGSLAVLRGSPDAISPRTQEAVFAAARHEYVDPFVQRWKGVSTTEQPDVLVAADVNGDGHLDLVTASRGGRSVYVWFGNGKGAFAKTPAVIAVAGGITALGAYRPGAPVLGQALLVGYQTGLRGRVAIVTFGSTGLRINSSYALPGAPSAFSVANLDSDLIPDTAIVAGGELLVLHGANALAGRGRLEVLPVTGVQSVAAGEFRFDRHAQMQLAVVTDRGGAVILAHQGFDSRPYTPQEIATTRHKNAVSLSQLAGNTGDEPWIEVENHSELTLHQAGSNAPVMLRSRLSGSGGDDLVVFDPDAQQRVVIRHPVLPAGLATAARSSSLARNSAVSPDVDRFSPSRVSLGRLSSGDVVAALSMRVSADGRPGLVILSSANPSPEIVVPAAGNTFYVNTTADNGGTSTDPPTSTRCTQGQDPTSNPCTLRDAIAYVNQDAADNIGTSDTIMLPTGTYNLTQQSGVFDGNGNALTHLEVLGPVTIVGNPNTIIDAQSNDVVFTINPGPYGSVNPSGDSYVFDMTIENVIMQNGVNKNNPSTNNSGLTNNVGGGINWDAFGTGNLTLSGSTVQNCVAKWGPGGGVWTENSNGSGTGTLTLDSTAIQNNSTPEQGGGLYVAFPPAATSATATTFASNTAEPSVNPGDPGGEGTAGGLYFTARSGSSTPQTVLSGVTIASNSTTVDGGGIFTNSGILLETSYVTNNSAGRWGGGLFTEQADPEGATTVTSTNFLSNSGVTTGGGIAVGPDNPSSGNSLQISLSRIFGNASTNGTKGLATVSPGTAIAKFNWWGCNAGPTDARCDKADSGATYTPWATFGLSATSSTNITIGGDIGLALSLNTDSAGNAITGAFPAVSNANYTYSFSVSGVTADPIPNGTFDTTGAGSATLTPTSTGGGTVSAKFDNQTDSVNFNVSAITTSLQLTVTPSNSFPYGQPPTLVTVQLTPTAATSTPSDFQLVLDGSVSAAFTFTSLGSNLYQISGPYNALAPAGHSFEVKYLGDGSYAPTNTSTTLSVGLGATNITAEFNPTNPIQGQGGTVTVTVAGVGSGAMPTGSITYALDSGAPTTEPLTAGSAQISIPTLITTGSHTLSITYNGDSNYATNSTSAPFTVNGRSQTFITSLTATTATIGVYGLGFTAPSGQLDFTDTSTSNPVAAPVTLNTGTATTALTPMVAPAPGAQTLPVWTELADLNGDGILDLVTSQYATDSVTVQLGNGDGTFKPASSVFNSSGFGPSEVHAVSLRGNGTLDLIVGSFNVNEIAVLLGNNNNGTFGSPVFYTVGSATSTPTSLTSGDFNHDDHLDVATANYKDGTVSILSGDGTGALTVSGSPISVGNAPEAIRAGDFNGDNYSDLAVANYADGTISILVNNQNGTFTKTNVGNGAQSGPQALAITGSGITQLLAVANFKANTVNVLRNNGSGVFTIESTIPVGHGPDDVKFADFNGDGIPDLVVANYTDSTVNLVLASSGGTYSVSTPFAVGKNPYSAAVGDLDFNSTPDVVVSNCFSNNTGVLLDGTLISVPYTGLSLTPGNSLQGSYTPDSGSKYGSSTSATATAP